MTTWLDLTTLLLTEFPTHDMERGICHTQWQPSTFYGDVHHGRQRRWPNNADASRMWTHWEQQLPINDWNIQLTSSGEPYSWARTDEANIWRPTASAAAFTKVLAWLLEQDILEHLGRVVIFISQNGHETPHADWTTGSDHSANRTAPVDFMWYSRGGKRIDFENQTLPKCCWFDNRLQHKAVSNKVWSWSIRADGTFTKRVKELIK